MAIQFKNLVDVFEQRTGAVASDAYTLTVSTEQTPGATPNPGTGGLKVQYYSVSSGTTHGFGLVAGSSSSDFLTTGPMHFYTNSDLDTVSATGLAMVLDNNQRLGIGTTSPGAKLDVNGGIRLGQYNTIQWGSNTSNQLIIQNYLSGAGITQAGSGDLELNSASNGINFKAGGLTKAKLLSSGNFGIGTSNPSSIFHIDSGTTTALFRFQGGGGFGRYTQMYNQDNDFLLRADSSSTGTSTGTVSFAVGPTDGVSIGGSGQLTFWQYGSGTFTGTATKNLAVDSSGNVIETDGSIIDGSGTANYVAKWSDPNTLTDSVVYDNGTNVGIGTTNPVNKLDVAGNIGIDESIIHNGDTDTKIGFVANDNFAITTAGSERVRVTSGGSLGVGTNNPVNKLDVTGSIGIDEYIVHNGDTNTKFGFPSAGVVTFGADPANPTWYVDLVNKTVGFRTTTPGSALDVNGTLRARNELNVGATSEQNFFVEGGSGPRYVKMGAYTPSNKDTWLSGPSSTGLCRATAGFGTGGKIVMATYRYTTKIEPGGWPTSSGVPNGVNVTPTPSSTEVMIVKGIFVHKAGSTIGSGWSSNSYPVIFTQEQNNGNYAFIGGVDRTTIVSGSGAWFYNGLTNRVSLLTLGRAGMQGGLGQPVKLSLDAAPITNEPTWYITVEYSIINLNVYRSNVDQTLT